MTFNFFSSRILQIVTVTSIHGEERRRHVASSRVKAIEYLENKIGSDQEITLETDNYSAQNKCCTMFTTLCWLVNRENVQVDRIIIKYLEPGYTFMFHHKVELGIKRSKKLDDFQDFVQAVQKVGTPLVMQPTDFMDRPKSYGKSKACKADWPLLAEI